MAAVELRRLPRIIFIAAAVLLLVAGLVLSSSIKAKADDLPVTHVYGTLSENTTWTANHVYVAEGVYIPSGVTLTVEAGAIVKANSNQAIIVQAGGTLQVNGSSSSVAAFTSYDDDSLGGDSNGDGAGSGAQGNFTFVTSYSGGHVIVSHASFKYASRSMLLVCTNQSANELSLADSTLYSELEISSCNEGSASIVRNHFEVSQDYPIYASSIAANIIPLVGLNQNTFSGNGASSTLRVEGNSYVPQGNSWTIDMTGGLSAIFLRGGLSILGSLTVNPGSIVKADDYTAADVFHIESGGTLTANGTSTNPIYITSILDDSLGGDSGDDGYSVGSANKYQFAFDIKGGATLNASHVAVHYARVSLGVVCSPSAQVGLSDSDLDGPVQIGNCSSASDVQIKRNHFNTTQQNAAYINNSNVRILTLNGADRNTFSGSGMTSVVSINNGFVPASETWTVGNNTGMSALVAGIDVSGTLNIDPGVVYKAGGVYLVTLENGGTLNVSGTNSSPIVFTSLEDDSVGGDSAGDGATTGAPNLGYWSAVRINGGTATISHAQMKYGSNSIAEFGTNSDKGMLSITDCTFQSGVSISNRTADNLSLKRNNFAVTNNALPIDGSYIDPSSIVLTGSDKNTFTGINRQIAINLYGTTIGTGKMWNVDSSSGLGAILTSAMTVDGTLSLGTGVNMKIAGSIQVDNGGQLTANGTSFNPVVFTSYNDDTAGGDSNGDGPSTGTLDNYTTTVKAKSGSNVNLNYVNMANAAVAVSAETPVTVSHANINNVGTAFDISTTNDSGQSDLTDVNVDTAANGLYVSNNSQVKYRGSLHNISNKGVQACLWQQDCAVDVTYTDWGSADGPFPSSGVLACGKVLVTPWKYNGTTHIGLPFNINNCDMSLSPTQATELKAHAFHMALIDKQADCDQNIQDACDVANAMIQCVQNQVLDLASIVYPELGYAVPSNNSPASAAENYVGDFEGAAGTYFNALDENSTVSRTLRIKSTASAFVSVGQAYDGCLN